MTLRTLAMCVSSYISAFVCSPCDNFFVSHWRAFIFAVCASTLRLRYLPVPLRFLRYLRVHCVYGICVYLVQPSLSWADFLSSRLVPESTWRGPWSVHSLRNEEASSDK